MSSDRDGGVFEIPIERLQRLQHGGTGDLDVDVELGGAVLQRLKLADPLAELLALLEIVYRAGEHLLAQANHFGGDRAASDIDDALQQRAPLIDLAEHLIGIDFDIVERNPRGIVGIDHDGAFRRNALCLRIDQEQR